MSKTYPEHCISLTDSAKDMFGKLMSIPDTLITRYYSLLTDVEQSELVKMDKEIESGSINPRDIKMKLAHMITEAVSYTHLPALQDLCLICIFFNYFCVLLF